MLLLKGENQKGFQLMTFLSFISLASVVEYEIVYECMTTNRCYLRQARPEHQTTVVVHWHPMAWGQCLLGECYMRAIQHIAAIGFIHHVSENNHYHSL